MLAASHAPYSQGNCAACHLDGGAVKATGEKLCLPCHGRIKEELAQPHTHAATRDDQACLDCHSPHAGKDPSLMAGSSEAATCLRCHDAAQFRGKASHLSKTPDCTACHGAHGSPEPKLLRASLDVLCNECHESAAKHQHPLGGGILDPRTNEPMTCLSCHEAHASDHGYQLIADHRRDLCVECHASGL